MYAPFAILEQFAIFGDATRQLGQIDTMPVCSREQTKANSQCSPNLRPVYRKLWWQGIRNLRSCNHVKVKEYGKGKNSHFNHADNIVAEYLFLAPSTKENS